MGKRAKKHNRCPLAENCAADRPTAVVGLGWRVLYTVMAWVVLGAGIMPGNGFFVSLVLFSMPLLMDYLRFDPDTKRRRRLRYLGIGFSVFCAMTGFFGLAGIFGVELVQNELCFVVAKNYIVAKGALCPLERIWYIIGTAIPLTIADWVIYEGYLEKDMVHEYPTGV